MQRIRSLKQSQRGLTMFGFLFVAIMFIAAAILAMKLVPAYIEFFSLKKVLSTMGQDSGLKSMSNAEIRDSFRKRAGIGDVTSIKQEDLSIVRSSGIPVITAEYEFRTPLVGNVSLVVDFSASSDPNATRAEIE
jgi:Domain of unknown function (DUF4845)